MKPLASIPFTSRGGFVEAALTALAAARETLVLYDRDFRDWPLDRPSAAESIARLLGGNHAARLRLMVADPAWLERHAPRFLQLRQRFSQPIACRQVPASLAPTEGVLIADDRHVLRRAHYGSFRGRLSLEQPAEAEPLVEKYRALWDESTPCLHGTTLGL